ncbi:hypothetical protein L7F22_039870 [Adiantum nelumboides]|nr:hypothetical protein [Adiantum nelumboides]
MCVAKEIVMALVMTEVGANNVIGEEELANFAEEMGSLVEDRWFRRSVIVAHHGGSKESYGAADLLKLKRECTYGFFHGSHFTAFLHTFTLEPQGGVKNPKIDLKGMENGVEILFKEKQRRQRLAAALAGRTSWNNGKKHSAETRQRIRERTLEAMKNSKVRSLIIFGAFVICSKETKSKIKDSMARFWEKRKKLKSIQESCVEEWKEFVANGARIGSVGDTSYNWNSYDTILRELQYAWRLKTKSCSCKDPKAGMTSALRIKNYGMPMKAALCAYQEQQDSVMTKLRRRTQKTAEGMSDSSERVLKVFESVENDGASKLSRDSAVEAVSQIGQPIHRIVKVQQSKPMCKSLPANKINLTRERLERLKQIRAIRRTKENDKTKAFKESSQGRAVEKARVLMKEAQIAARELEAQAARDKSALRSLQDAQQLLSEAQALLKAAGIEEEIPTETGEINCL